MVNLQKEFIDFHDAIKLDDENDILREKRDILLDKLKKNISDDAPTYTHFNQGSYAMGTGIKPDDGDYDIDVGLKFDIDKAEYSDPVDVKKWVRDALDGHTKKIEIRNSCVTVTYQSDGEDAFHVDFAVYAAGNSDGRLYIAKGREYSSEQYRYWEESEPQELIDKIKSRFENNDDRRQFRRIIRYAKKWKNQHFDLSGNNAPTGIALTALAYSKFKPAYSIDYITGERKYDDFTAFKNYMNSIKDEFFPSYDIENHYHYYAITHQLPVMPGNNLFEKMSSYQQNNFYKKVDAAISKLEDAETKTKKTEACKIMTELFGDDFPVAVERSFVGTSESA